MQGCQAMLPIDDEKLAVRLAQKADTLGGIGSPKAQGLIRKEKNRPRNQRLVDRGFVEIDDLANLPSIKQPLKRFLAFFDPGNKPGDLVVAGHVGLDLFAFEIVTTGEA